MSSLSQAILLGQAGISFLAVSGGGIVPPQSFGVYNTGTGVMPWSVSTSTVTGGPWLQATPNAGSSDASSNTIPRVTVTVNPAGLAPGRYYGLVRVTSATAANSPQVVTATLEVLPPGQDPGAVVQPAQLNFFFPVEFQSRDWKRPASIPNPPDLQPVGEELQLCRTVGFRERRQPDRSGAVHLNGCAAGSRAGAGAADCPDHSGHQLDNRVR